MHTSFAGKSVVIGVSGSISAFKIAGWASSLVKEEAIVDVVMTSSAQKFIAPLTFEALTGRPAYTDMFPVENRDPMSHINLGRDTDCIIIAPATAQTIARLTYGLADDLLSTIVLAARVPVIVCPAMNTGMYEHPATQANIAELKKFGYVVVDPDCGRMACGDSGAGRLVEWDHAREYILRSLSTKDLSGQRVLVTAGPTRETYDPARYVSNRSSGKMGYALAQSAFRRGADVTLVSGPVSLAPPAGIELISVTSAQQMYDAVMDVQNSFSIIVKSAAVSDFRPAHVNAEKIKKENSTLVMELEQTMDILKELGHKRNPDRQLLIGFAAESTDIESQARIKLATKGLDLIAVNDITSQQAGFACDTNQLTLISQTDAVKLPLTTKIRTADLLWDYVVDHSLLRSQ